MFGLHGLITPGRANTLDTNGGMMYYQYDGRYSVTELTNRHGDEIERYRYDAFGNIYTGITAPYNAVGYTGQDYDDRAGLVQMDARWYDPNVGRFLTQDTYQGDIYTPQSLNLYSYVMNNPVNMWDPTGHVPSWVGQAEHIIYIDNTNYAHDKYVLNSSTSGTPSEWKLIDRTVTADKIVSKYESTIEKTWVYTHYSYKYTPVGSDGQGNPILDLTDTTQSSETYHGIDYHEKIVTIKASDMAQMNEQKIRELVGELPKDTDPPTRRGGGTVQFWMDDAVGGDPTELVESNQKKEANVGKKNSNFLDSTEPVIPFYIPSVEKLVGNFLSGVGGMGLDMAKAGAEIPIKEKSYQINGLTYLRPRNARPEVRPYKVIGKVATIAAGVLLAADIGNTWSEDNGNTGLKRLEKTGIQAAGFGVTFVAGYIPLAIAEIAGIAVPATGGASAPITIAGILSAAVVGVGVSFAQDWAYSLLNIK